MVLNSKKKLQNGPKCSKMFQTCQKMVKNCQKSSKMVQNGQMVSNCHNGVIWSDIVKNGSKRFKMAQKGPKNFQNLSI